MKYIRPNTELALLFTRRALAEIICDTVNLEGVPFTLPEVMTLLEGVTIGGRKVADEVMVLNQKKAWSLLFDAVKDETFALTKDLAETLNGLVGYDQVKDAGQFRHGQIFLSGTDYVPPHYEDLDDEFKQLLTSIEASQKSVIDSAIHIFLNMARTQYFYDGNKRTARLMMSGYLLSHGLPAINVPYARKLEYSAALIEFYDTGEEFVMNDFLKSCISEKSILAMT